MYLDVEDVREVIEEDSMGDGCGCRRLTVSGRRGGLLHVERSEWNAKTHSLVRVVLKD